jgi:hypothetical protein
MCSVSPALHVLIRFFVNASQQAGVAIVIHEQIAVQVPHAAQNLCEFAWREPECLPKIHRVKVLQALDGTHFAGALAREVHQQLQEHTCSQACDNTFSKALALHQEQQIWQAALASSQHERAHALA